MWRSAHAGTRSLGRTSAVLLTAAMIVGTGLFASLGAATAEAGSGILVAMLIGGMIALLTGISAAEVGVNYPQEGGAFIWMRRFGFPTISFLAGCAYLFGPFGPGGEPDPTIIQTAPRPDFFFLWLYALLSFLPPSAETPLLLIVPPLLIAALLALPFVAGEGEKSWRRRPVAVLMIALVAVSLGSLTHLGTYTPWSPVMDAWSGAPVPAATLIGRSALERRGGVVFQAKQCRNCHSLGESGGQRGPALDQVAVRLTEDQLVRQVIQGDGNMPAYGKNLTPAETTALVAFLETLRPSTQQPARDASRATVRAADEGRR